MPPRHLVDDFSVKRDGLVVHTQSTREKHEPLAGHELSHLVGIRTSVAILSRGYAVFGDVNNRIVTNQKKKRFYAIHSV